MATAVTQTQPQPKRWLRWAAIVAVLVVIAGVVWLIRRMPPSIPFGPYGNGGYASKMDFARVEKKYPLSPRYLAKLTPDNIGSFNQEQIDQIYARITPGPIPDGEYDMRIFPYKGESGKPRLAEIVGGLKGVGVDAEVHLFELLVNAVWEGKEFHRAERIAWTKIRGASILLPFLDEFFGAQRTVEQRRVLAASKLRFPAKIYCGQSLLDSRRESIVIDYNFGDEIPGYVNVPDGLLGRGTCNEADPNLTPSCIGGLMVRDEMRTVRPGFYLGRVHVTNVFVMNFTAYNSKVAAGGLDEFLRTGQTAQDCWIGPQSQMLSNAALP
jgi:hypothetical protein